MRLAAILGFRVPRDSDKLNDVLMAISGDSCNPWRLKTDPDTYPLFKDANRPPRPKEILRSTRYLANDTEKYYAPMKPLLADLRKQFSKKVVAEWKHQGIATFTGLFSWWWTEKVEDSEGFPETTITDVMREEFAMYEHHLKRLAQGTQSPLPNMLHSLVQQVARQDPAYYRVFVSLRPDNAWRFISFPCFLQLPIPDWEDSPNIIQGAIVVEDDDNWTKGDVNMATHGYSNDLKRTRLDILPGLIAVDENGETLEQPGLQAVTGLAASHRLLALPPQAPDELQREYNTPPLRFPFKGELGYLGPLSDALLGRRGWGSADVEAERRIVLGGPKRAEEFIRKWRHRAVTEVVKAFQSKKEAERERFKENSYFNWVSDNPETPFPVNNDPSPPRTNDKYAQYCG